MIASKSGKISASLEGERFDTAAAKTFPDLSRKRIKGIIDSGGAYLNRRRIVIAKFAVHAGDTIELFWNEQGNDAKAPTVQETWKALVATIPPEPIFVHEGFFVIDKPAGIPSQATLESSTETILHALCEANSTLYKLNDLHLVHRLDKETSGLMLIARNKRWQTTLENLFRERKVSKHYDAICLGRPQQKQGHISFPLEPDPARKNTWQPVFGRRKERSSPHHGNQNSRIKEASTDYTLIEEFGSVDASLIRCSPHTGRTHQIRVHLMAVGCPLVGDKTYARNMAGHPLARQALRHMLHAQSLSLALPSTGLLSWEVPWPQDFVTCLEEIRRQDQVSSGRARV